MSNLEKFNLLKEQWKRDTRHLSNISQKAMHHAYQRIIGMGEPAVALILEDLRDNGPDNWFWALHAITGENPITKDIAGYMDKMTEAWLEWGMKEGYL